MVHFLWMIPTLVLLLLLLYLWITWCNRKHNRAIDQDPSRTTKDRLLNDQNRQTGSSFRYGLHKASWNSCEAIAIHNAKILLGTSSTLSETMTAIQKAGGMMCYGLFGSDPFVIGRVMRSSGIHARRVRQTDMRAPGYYILSFWNEGAPWHGAHTVALRSDGTTWTIYNYFGNGRQTHTVPLTLGRRFICGYYLEGPR